jgi:hypothetical protein
LTQIDFTGRLTGGPDKENMMKATVKILRNERNIPAGKLADAELHFSGGELDGLKLIGFAVWQRRDGVGQNVTFPARQFTVHGEKRSFALLRAIGDPSVQDRVRELVLEAYAEQESNIVNEGVS